MDFPLFRRRKGASASPASPSPIAPTLESPSTFQVSATRAAVPEATIEPKNKERVVAMPSTFPEEQEDEGNIMMGLDRRASIDPTTVSVAHKSIEEEQVTKFRSQYFDDFFATRGQHNSPRTRVNQDSIVVVDLKLNTRVGDNESLSIDISSRMAQIYQRAETSVMVTIQQEACLIFGNAAVPAYLMTVTALPGLIAPVSNLRNTALIQTALQELLHIAPNRGVVIYVPIPEENFATNGVTALGEINRLEHQAQDEDPGFLKSISRSMSRRLKSSSAHSNPLSVATTSSWANAPEGQGSASRSTKDITSQSSSKDEGKTRAVKKSKSIRQMIMHGLADIGAAGPPGGMPMALPTYREGDEVWVPQIKERETDQD